MIPAPIALFFAKYGIRLLIGLVVIAAIVFAVHLYNERMREQGRAEIRKEWADAIEAQRAKEAKAIDTAVVKQETEGEKARVIYRTITRKVDRIVDRPIYRNNLCLDDDGLRAARDALRGPSAPAAKLDRSLPGSGTAQ